LLRKLSLPSGWRVCVRFDKKTGQFTDEATGNGVAAKDAVVEIQGRSRPAKSPVAPGEESVRDSFSPVRLASQGRQGGGACERIERSTTSPVPAMPRMQVL